MRLKYTKNFHKSYSKRIGRNKNLDKRFYERLQLFIQNPQNLILKDHKLTGARKQFRAFSVTGDIRVIYYIEKETIYLIDIGSHNQVY